MLLQNQVDEAIKLLVGEINPFVIYLFGSASRDEMHEQSDVDLAFSTDKEVSQYDVFCLAQELADIFKRDVDLVNLNVASTVFKAQVIGGGRDIYCNDSYRRDLMEIRILKEYALLNEERECILRDIKERGKIYE